MLFIISRGYAEVQILKTSKSDPSSFWPYYMDKKYRIFMCNKCSDITHLLYYKNFNSCELRIENSVTTVTVQHREACRVMPNSYPE